jgi:hypothetical protein
MIMSKIRVQLLDEKDVVRDQFMVDLNGEGAMEKIDENLIDGYDWFKGLRIITGMWFPFCSSKEDWALQIKKDFDISEKMNQWRGNIDGISYLYLRNSDGSYTLEKW